jgi:DNA-binding CsgD family transcriptional regulator
MLCEAAVAAPLLIVVDDAQLLDVATSDVLLFVSRRLELEPIMMVFAVRDGSTTGIDRAGLPELQLEPLDDAAAGALLDATSPGIEPGVRRRVLAEALGNPLALVELPQAASGFELMPANPLPLTDRLERAFATRMSRLPAPARALLLVTALDDGGDQERLVDAAATFAGEAVGAAEIAAAKAAQAISAGGDGLRFRHPLMRSAVYQAALASERRAAHAALASVYKGDPDRTIWHQAASLAGPDNQIAGELELMAERSAGRGATTTAVAARAALDGFEALAFPALAEVARLELRASGVVPRRRLPEAWAQLTPQELQIAQMAAAGHTNRAIGQRLYLSPRTIQSHMYNIFPKLGITSRSQLRDVFAGLEPAY